MKKALLCLLFALNCNAKDLAYADNVIGGMTVLTNDVCRYNRDMLEAYATNDKDQKLYACYVIVDNNVFFVLKNGSVRMMLKKQFQLMKGSV